MDHLLGDVEVVGTSGGPVEVGGVEYDSRRVRPGDVFCCVTGQFDDGHEHAAEAVARGAAALVVSHPLPLAVPQVQVPDVRRAMARLAAAFWGNPSTDLTVVGVTGTNGKTTVTHLLSAALAAAGRPMEVLGTLSGPRTTAEAPELQRTLAGMRPGTTVAMEVSSHALAQWRVEAVHFDVAVFTNLSHDHLDFHGTMEKYFAAKASLFEPGRAGRGVVDADDPWGARLLAGARIPMVAVHRDQAVHPVLSAGRATFTWRGVRVDLAMPGAVNVRNALLAAETAYLLGVDPTTVAAGLARATPVPGRLEVMASPAGFWALVDYAHTPAGLEVVLAEARRMAKGRVVVVFGCGGDRDRAKRPLMGEAASRLADAVVVTSDNPRHEDPGAIAAAVVAGAPGAVVELDRRRAIGLALADARPGDVVVVAGKGHEQYQEIGDERFPFDDRDVVRRLLGKG